MRVILFENSVAPAACCAYEAISRFARTAGWDLQTIEYGVPGDGKKHELGSNVPDIPSILDLWHPDGVIVECSGRKPVFRLRDFKSIPVVLMDCYPTLCALRVNCVHHDDAALAKLAAAELLPMGLSGYAYVPYPEATEWSAARGRAFERLVALTGRRCHVLKMAPRRGRDLVSSIKDIADQLLDLPRPCGIFAVNDEIARRVISACEAVGLSVPDDVAVVGIDNDEKFCENASVTLSSVSVDSDGMGDSAAQLLADLMSGRQRSGECVVCGSGRLVRRMSSVRGRAVDARMARAIEYIRLHACDGISAEDVARKMGCSRRLADLRFREALGHTVFDEIHAVRIERVKDLLVKPGQEVFAIPDLCGYGSLADLCRDFKKRTGQALRGWRSGLPNR